MLLVFQNRYLMPWIWFFGKPNSIRQPSQTHSIEDEGGKVGFPSYSSGQDGGNTGKVWYSGSSSSPSEVKLVYAFGSLQGIMMPLVLGIPVLIASFFRSAFSRALDFAGIYANCFLFGILPPVMTYIYQSRKRTRYVNRSQALAHFILTFISNRLQFHFSENVWRSAQIQVGVAFNLVSSLW